MFCRIDPWSTRSTEDVLLIVSTSIKICSLCDTRSQRSTPFDKPYRPFGLDRRSAFFFNEYEGKWAPPCLTAISVRRPSA